MLRILVVALVLLVAAIMLLPRPGQIAATPAVATVLTEPRELPTVAMVDKHGGPFALADLAGRPTLVFFGFTNCPDICPLSLAAIAAAMDDLRLRDAEPPQVLFVSVDAERDSPERIESYLQAFDPAFLGVTGSDQDLAPLLDALSVTVHKESRGDETYNVVHNGTIYVLDSDVRWAALFGGSSHQPQVIADDYAAMQASL